MSQARANLELLTFPNEPSLNMHYSIKLDSFTNLLDVGLQFAKMWVFKSLLNDRTRFPLISMFLVGAMDDVEILYERKHKVDNDTGFGPT